jgi:predicted amidohydrolase YtcJ
MLVAWAAVGDSTVVGGEVGGEEQPAELIVLARRIWTGDPARPWAEAVAVREGRLVAVGRRDEALGHRGPQTRVIEQADGFGLPGLIDAHGHVSSLGSKVDELDLRGVRSVEEVARRVAERIEREPGDGWIRGRNWDQSLWPGGRFPTARDLDGATGSRPVLLERVDGHAAWANSEAMRRAGINAESKAPRDGQIVRDERGEPTGVFVDGAISLLYRVVPAPAPVQIERRILAAQTECLRHGLTMVHDAGVDRIEAEIYRRLDAEGKLKLRIYAMMSPPAGKEVEAVSTPPVQAGPNGRFEMRAIKLFIDGAMGSRGGLLFEPYSDDRGNSGLLLIEPEKLCDVTRTALSSGWQVCTHAIGDRGNAIVLDAYEAALGLRPEARNPRLRIEHAQVVRRSDVARFARSGIVASMQPSHASTDKRWADERLGGDSARVEGAYAWRWFVDERVSLAFGSDFPVEVSNPCWGIYAALTRQDEAGAPVGGWHPEQRLTLEETLAAFTRGSAYAAFAEERLGVVKEGFAADLILLDRDLFESTPAEILEAKVTHTLVGGEVVFER